jgi:4-carboxymuconolactone decarboxylase
MPANYTEEEVKQAREVLYNEGLKMRYQVAGKDYVDASLKKGKGTIGQAMQEVRASSPGHLVAHWSNTSKPDKAPQYVTEACWGSIWTRPGLELKTRSFLNIVMLCCQNRGSELATHVKGAMTNGATEEEIREVILQAACYCGMPAGIEGFRVAAKAIEEWQAHKAREGHASDPHADLDLSARLKPEDDW